MTTENQEQSKEEPHSQNKPEHRWHDRFWRRPIDTVKLLRGLIRRSESEQNGDCYTPWLSYVRSKIIPNWGNIFVSCCLFAGVISFLYAVGLFESNRVVAFFTIVLTVVAALQCWTYHKQWQVMRDQHDAMRDQHIAMVQQIKLARRASRQTEEALKLNRMQLRAWVHFAGSKIDSFLIDRPIKYVVKIRNSGAVPATITGIRMVEYPSSPTNTVSLARANAHASGLKTVQIRIAPGRNAKIESENSRTLSHDEIIMLAGGRLKLFVSGVVTYVDDLGNEDAFDWVLTYDEHECALIDQIE